MTIEAKLDAINGNLKRIADSLEVLLAEQGVVAEGDPEPKKAPAKKKAAKKKTSKANKKTVGKTDDKDGDAEHEFDDVRVALKKLKAGVSQAAVKSLLKKFGASTIGQVDEKNYGQLISEAEDQLE